MTLMTIKTLISAVIFFGTAQLLWNYSHLVSKLKSAHKFEQPFPTSAGNTTLGFQRMVYINLAHRHDYDDAMTLQSLVSNITLTRQPGVYAVDLKDAGLPPASEGGELSYGEDHKRRKRMLSCPCEFMETND
jgi:hypothetical protein